LKIAAQEVNKYFRRCENNITVCLSWDLIRKYPEFYIYLQRKYFTPNTLDLSMLMDMWQGWGHEY